MTNFDMLKRCDDIDIADCDTVNDVLKRISPEFYAEWHEATYEAVHTSLDICRAMLRAGPDMSISQKRYTDNTVKQNVWLRCAASLRGADVAEVAINLSEPLGYSGIMVIDTRVDGITFGSVLDILKQKYIKKGERQWV